MATPNIVPRAAGEGGIGTSAKGWGKAFITNTTASSATQGGALQLAADDGAVMADNHRLGVIEFKGAEDTSNTLSIGARIQAICRDAWDASNNDADLEFYTTDGTTESKVLTLDADKKATFTGALETTGAATLASIVCTAGATFGGGTGSTGATITTAGVGTFDGAISSTAGAVTGLNYRTMWVGAGAMIPTVTAGAVAGTEELATNDVMVDYFAFPTGSDAFVNFSVVMPEQWDGGTLKAKFYWKSSNTDTGDVQWKIASVAHADSGALDTAFGTAVAVGTDDVGLGTDNDLHITAATAAMTVAGTPAEGELVIFQIMRDVSGDNYNADAHLMGVLIQYRETATASAAW
jgi:hypothetical protein